LLSLIKQSSGLQVGNSMRTAIGVEKNPWMLAYMGAKATTAPRQIFFPFGDPVEFKAKAYAMPFGGRIGPWYGQVWAVGAPNSSGAKVGLYPERLSAGGIMNSTNKKDLIPNSSRYPGDRLGMTSRLAQISLNQLQSA